MVAIFEASKTSYFDEGIILSKVAKITRHHLSSPDQVFYGALSQQKQTASVPKELIHFVSQILEGKSQHQQVSGNSHAIAVNLSQLIRFNAVKTKRKLGDSHFRHSKANEPPLPIKTGLMIHSQTRKKSIVNDLAAAGLSVTYNRIQEIQDSIGQQLCEKYEREKIVCPCSLKPDLFIFGAIYNVDHNPNRKPRSLLSMALVFPSFII